MYRGAPKLKICQSKSYYGSLPHRSRNINSFFIFCAKIGSGENIFLNLHNDFPHAHIRTFIFPPHSTAPLLGTISLDLMSQD